MTCRTHTHARPATKRKLTAHSHDTSMECRVCSFIVRDDMSDAAKQARACSVTLNGWPTDKCYQPNANAQIILLDAIYNDNNGNLCRTHFEVLKGNRNRW